MCEYKNKLTPATFEVVNNGQNILGLATCTEMNLVKRIDTIQSVEHILDEYSDVFQGLGHITNVVHNIKLKKNQEPVVHPPRRVPVALRNKVKQELDRMEDIKVVERVKGPSEWVNSMVNSH